MPPTTTTSSPTWTEIAKGARALRFWTNVTLLAAFLAGASVIAIRGGNTLTGLMWAGACLGLGGLLGFLFGIPRTSDVVINQPVVAATTANIGVTTANTANTQATSNEGAPEMRAIPPTPTPPNPSSSRRGQESSLEQIADWVTKLLLGGGLTQLQQIPEMFTNWGYHVALGLGAPGDAAANQVFATALIIYFLILGFFGGYLITLLQLRTEIADDRTRTSREPERTSLGSAS
jgi:hypothetical protein